MWKQTRKTRTGARQASRRREGLASIEMVMSLPILIFMGVMIFALNRAHQERTRVAVDARHEAWKLRLPTPAPDPLRAVSLTKGTQERSERSSIRMPPRPMSSGGSKTAESHNSLMVGRWSDDMDNVGFFREKAPHVKQAMALVVGGLGGTSQGLGLLGDRFNDFESTTLDFGSLTEGIDIGGTIGGVTSLSQVDMTMGADDLISAAINPLNAIINRAVGALTSEVLGRLLSSGISTRSLTSAADSLNSVLRIFIKTMRAVANPVGALSNAVGPIAKLAGPLAKTFGGLAGLAGDAIGSLTGKKPKITEEMRKAAKALDMIEASMDMLGQIMRAIDFLADAVDGKPGRPFLPATIPSEFSKLLNSAETRETPREKAIQEEIDRLKEEEEQESMP